MKKNRLINYYTIFLTIGFLLFPFQAHTVDKDIAYISSNELHEMLEKNDLQYVYLDKEFSDLYKVISRIILLDDSNDSILSKLCKYVDEGFCIAEYDFVVEILNYAAKTLEK